MGFDAEMVHSCDQQVLSDCWQKASVTGHVNLSMELLECPYDSQLPLNQVIEASKAKAQMLLIT